MGARVECSQGGGGSSRAALTQEKAALRPPLQVVLLSQVSFFPTIFNLQHFLQLIKSQTTVEVTTIIHVTTGFPVQ